MSFIDKGEELCAGGLILLGRKVMPPKDIRGDVARVYYYMDKAYPNRGIISSKNKKLFLNWSSSDPISRQECDLYKEKKKVQLNINPILETPCQKN
jgi:deoxyribonuclease-1